MAPLRFIDVSKVYPNGVKAVSHLTLDVQRLQGTVDLVEEMGAEKLVHFRIDAERLSIGDERLAGADDETGGELNTGEIGTAAASAGVARIASRSEIAADQKAEFMVDTASLHLFDPDEGASLRGETRQPQASQAQPS